MLFRSKGLSAGRVQSVAVRLIVDREREIEAFVPVEYWTVEARLRKQVKEAKAASRLAGPSWRAMSRAVSGRSENESEAPSGGG